jgi:6-phosphogluconolactonase (cycloisomerase 2 family)
VQSKTLTRLQSVFTFFTLLLTLSLLAGCGGSKSSSNNSGGSNSGGTNSGGTNTGGSNTGGSGQSSSTLVYLLNNGSTKQVQGFKFSSDNTFSAVPGSPYPNSSYAVSVAIADSTLVASSSPGIKAWAIDSSTGSLTPGSTIAGGSSLASFGNNIYASASTNVTAYSASSGTLTQVGSPVSVASLCQDCQPGQLQVSNDGKYVYAEVFGFHDVNGFVVIDRAADGSVSNARLVQAVNGSTSAAAAVVVSADNHFIYEFNQSGQIMLWQFDPAAGTATLANQSVESPAGIVDQARISPDGKYLAAVSPGVNRIDMFSINASTGALTKVPGAPFATGTNPTRLAFSSDSQTLFVDCRSDGSADLFAYHIGADGSLSQVAHQVLGGDPSAIAVK